MFSSWPTWPEDDKLQNSIYSLKDAKAYGFGLANAKSSQWKLTETSEGLLNEINKDKGFGINIKERFKIPDVHSNAKKQTTMGNNQDKANAIISAVKFLTQKEPEAPTAGFSPHLNVKKPQFPFYIPDEEWL